jgi:hypothetical protein
LSDARFLQFKTSILGMIQSSIYAGLIHFEVFPNLSVSLDDIHFLKSLTLNIQTKGYNMEEGSRPRNSFSGSATTEGFKRRDKEIDDLLASASNLKVTSVANDSANSQISQAFYSTKSHPLHNREDDEDSGPMSPSASDMNGPMPPPPPPQQIPHHLKVIQHEPELTFEKN